MGKALWNCKTGLQWKSSQHSDTVYIVYISVDELSHFRHLNWEKKENWYALVAVMAPNKRVFAWIETAQFTDVNMQLANQQIARSGDLLLHFQISMIYLEQ